MKKPFIILGCLFGLAGSVLAGVGTVFIAKQSEAVQLIGGADGPTAIFVAGKLGPALPIALTVAGLLLIGAMVVCLMKS